MSKPSNRRSRRLLLLVGVIFSVLLGLALFAHSSSGEKPEVTLVPLLDQATATNIPVLMSVKRRAVYQSHFPNHTVVAWIPNGDVETHPLGGLESNCIFPAATQKTLNAQISENWAGFEIEMGYYEYQPFHGWLVSVLGKQVFTPVGAWVGKCVTAILPESMFVMKEREAKSSKIVKANGVWIVEPALKRSDRLGTNKPPIGKTPSAMGR